MLPAYKIVDAARYAKTSTNTVSYWHHGGDHKATLPRSKKGEALSYMELSEIAFVAAMRKAGVSLQSIRNAREYLSQRFNSEFPFAMYQFKTDGKDLLMNYKEFESDADDGTMIAVNRSGQLAWEKILEDRFAEFDYEAGLAIRWHPAGRESHVVIDPQIKFGAPTVDGVPTWILKGRIEAGESLIDISDDFGIEESKIKEALDFEGVKVH